MILGIPLILGVPATAARLIFSGNHTGPANPKTRQEAAMQE